MKKADINKLVKNYITQLPKLPRKRKKKVKKIALVYFCSLEDMGVLEKLDALFLPSKHGNIKVI